VAVLGDAGAPEERAAVLAMHGWALILRGRTAPGRAAMRAAEALARDLDPLGSHWPWLHLFLRTRIALGEIARAERDGLALAGRAREAGALATLGGGLVVAADAAFRLGDWAAADAATSEAIQVAGETAQRSWHGYALTTRARLAGARGDADAARACAASAREVAVAGGISTGLRFIHAAAGFAELSAERVPEAIAALEAAERMAAGSGHEEPMLAPWAPDLAEAYVRGGRREDAARILRTLDRHAALTGLAFPAAAAARARGMLAGDFDAPFAEALAHEERAGLPFERARTLLAHGRRLHRARRRAEARERLREAHAGFTRLGAAAWAVQAEHELRAAGARRRTAAAPDALTPQEQRVIAAVRRGATNREIATELFLAPKTVEFHLGQIYRKVGVRSRTQLVAAVPDER
jgi:DNA-binding CsgD family transcriptional regulator